MNPVMRVKMLVDVVMTVALFVCMAYILVGEDAHEWTGMLLMLLYVLHSLLNRGWYGSLLKGRYNLMRAFNTTITLTCLVTMLIAGISGMAMSRNVYIGFLRGHMSLARTAHILSSYWGFCFVSLHVGMYWSMMISMMKSSAAGRKLTPRAWRLLSLMGFLLACFGVNAMLRQNILSYMFLRSPFVFFDFERPLALFFLDYFGIMALFVWIAHYLRKFIIKLSQRKGK